MREALHKFKPGGLLFPLVPASWEIDMSVPAVEPGQLYRHFKGGRYEVVLLATDSETNADMVVYRDLGTGRHFVRSLDMFISPKVFEDGRKVERFVLEE